MTRSVFCLSKNESYRRRGSIAGRCFFFVCFVLESSSLIFVWGEESGGSFLYPNSWARRPRVGSWLHPCSAGGSASLIPWRGPSLAAGGSSYQLGTEYDSWYLLVIAQIEVHRVRGRFRGLSPFLFEETIY